jgi:hypothetical protein
MLGSRCGEGESEALGEVGPFPWRACCRRLCSRWVMAHVCAHGSFLFLVKWRQVCVILYTGGRCVGWPIGPVGPAPGAASCSVADGQGACVWVCPGLSGVVNCLDKKVCVVVPGAEMVEGDACGI